MLTPAISSPERPPTRSSRLSSWDFTGAMPVSVPVQKQNAGIIFEREAANVLDYDGIDSDEEF
jgi:hypothetical protein